MKTVQIGFTYNDIVDGAHLWSCNNLHIALPVGVQPAAWFQIHREEDLYKETDQHLEWLKEDHPFPVYMVRHFDKYPASVPLPVEELKKLWPFEFPPSFGSSFSWMVALAIHLKYKRIEVRGIELMTPREAFTEAPNFMAWLGVAAGRKIKVNGVGRLFDPYLYGQEERDIPFYLPADVAKDLIIDQNLYTRREYSRWKQLASYVYSGRWVKEMEEKYGPGLRAGGEVDEEGQEAPEEEVRYES